MRFVMSCKANLSNTESCARATSALGQKQKCAAHKPMSALPLIVTVKADINLSEQTSGIR